MSTRPSSRSLAVAIVTAMLCLLVLGYSLVVAGQLLLGVLFCVLVVGLVVAYRLLGAFLRFVDAVERIADTLERRNDAQGARTPRSHPDDGSRRDDARNAESRTEASRSRVRDRW